MNTEKKDNTVILELLQAVEQQSDLTQRSLAARLGVALGLANAYLKRCIRKGYVKVRQVPANRYLYYLTPKGFTEKSRLTAEYLKHSFDFYSLASESISNILRKCVADGHQRLLICGVSELAEITIVRVLEYPVTVVGIYDIDYGKDMFLKLPVNKNIEQCGPFDACIITAIESAPEYYSLLNASVQTSRIMVPEILGLNIPGNGS